MNKNILSDLGQKMNRLSGVRAIMKDIQEVELRAAGRHLINLSPGNPVLLPEVAEMWKTYGQEVLASSEYNEIVGRYGMTEGYLPFIEAVVDFYNRKFHWGLTTKNILIVGGSQLAYFMLINMFCGKTGSSQKKVLHPIVPDYTGYSCLGLEQGIHTAIDPEIEIIGPHIYKYHPDWRSFKVNDSTGAVLFSRPSNPTGNVFTDEETSKVVQEAKKHLVPVIIDSAYAPPIPAINFSPMELVRDVNTIYVFSFSKCGLPGERLAIVIADEHYIDALYSFKANIAIHSSRFGQALAQRALQSGKLEQLAQTVINPFYTRKSQLAQKTIKENWDDTLPYYIHRSEGTLFLWVWFKDLPVTDQELYSLCKEQLVMIVPGEQFFFGQANPTKHNRECIRISLTATDEDLVEGLKRIGNVLKRVYA